MFYVFDNFTASFFKALDPDVSVQVRLVSGETLLQVKAPLVIGGNRTQVLADSMAIAASALNQCAT